MVVPVGNVLPGLGSGCVLAVGEAFYLQGGENDSAAALSNAAAALPIDWTIPSRVQALTNASAMSLAAPVSVEDHSPYVTSAGDHGHVDTGLGQFSGRGICHREQTPACARENRSLTVAR